MATTKSNSSSSSNSYSNTSTSGGSHSETYTEGGSHSETKGYSDSTSSSNGGASSTSAGKSYASGTVSDATQEGYNKSTQDYVQSDAVTNAYNALQAAASNKPTFQSTYADKLSNLYDQIMNRDKFSYNFNEDSMYQLYKDQYTQQGKQAMQDTMGQAAALSGGYNSSYAQTAGQQTYQNYLQQLNDIIPELRQEAYEEYQAEGEDLLNKYNVTNNAYNNEYSQYRDDVSDWQTDRSYNQSAYQDERNFDYDQYTNDRSFWQNEYWQEKNAEQSNIQQTDESNWNESQSHTDDYSETNTQSWSHSTTDASNWSNSATTGWSNEIQNNWGTSSNSGSGSGSSGNTVGWASYSAANSNTRQGLINGVDTASGHENGLADYYSMSKDEMEEYGYTKSGAEVVKQTLKDYYDNGTTNENGDKVTYTKEDIASLYRAILAGNNDQGAGTYTTAEIMKILGIK